MSILNFADKTSKVSIVSHKELIIMFMIYLYKKYIHSSSDSLIFSVELKAKWKYSHGSCIASHSNQKYLKISISCSVPRFFGHVEAVWRDVNMSLPSGPSLYETVTKTASRSMRIFGPYSWPQPYCHAPLWR